ncbi:MAG: hypothetical protein ACTSXD_05090 [Candidatus Heimdallarchaeaceae archaeon]
MADSYNQTTVTFQIILQVKDFIENGYCSGEPCEDEGCWLYVNNLDIK